MHSKTCKNKKNERIAVIAILLILCFMGPFLYNKIVNFFDDSVDIIDTLKVEDFIIEKSDNYYNDYYVIEIGEEFTPTISFYPENLSYYQKSITYQNSNSNCLSIDYKGNFKGLKEGKTTVKLISNDNSDITKTINVMVIRSNNELRFSNNLTSSKQIYSVGTIVPIEYYAYGPITLGDIELTSSNSDVAYVIDNYLYANSIGVSNIKIQSSIDPNVYASIEIKVVGSYDGEETTSVSFLDTVTAGGINFNKEQFLATDIHEGYSVTLNASGNGKRTGQVEFSFNDNSLVDVISVSDTSITFKCLRAGDLKVFAKSKFNSDIQDEIEFSILPIDPRSFFKLVSPSSDMFVEKNGVTYLSLNAGEIEPVKVFSKDFEIKSGLIITSSNSEIVKIEDGNLKALTPGITNVKILYEYNEKCEISFQVKVINPLDLYSKIENITLINMSMPILDYDDNNVKVGQTIELEFDIYPYYATNLHDIIVKLSDNTKIKLNKEIIENKLKLELDFVDIGFTELMIVVSENENLNLQYSFIITNSKKVNFTYTPTRLIERGQTASIRTEIDEELRGVNFTYSSSNEKVIKVSQDGLFIGLGYGTATISIHATDGVTSFDESFEVECVKEHSLYDALNTFKTIVKMNDEEINLNEKLMYIGDSFTIDVSFTPSNHPFGKYHEVKIEKPEILSVDKNNNKYTFKCLKSGTTKVTVYPYANPDFSVEYTVVIANIMPKFMFVSVPDKVMYVEDRYQFGYLIDWRATYSNVDIIIGDDSMVSVEDDYLVIKKAGKTYVSFIIDDNDDNTVSYVQTLNIEAFDHSTGVRLERYGYGNFIVRIISQVICALIIGILAFVIASKKPLKLNSVLNYAVVICGILGLLILCNVLRMSIKPLDYEKYDMLTNIISYVAGLFIGFVIYLLRSRKEKGKNA